MIHVNIYMDSVHNFKQFTVKGHADYAKAGRDIICASVSMLVMNTINSIETLTQDTFVLQTDKSSGLIKFKIKSDVSPESELLINSMILGLESVRKDYGKKYITITYKEV